MSPVGASLKRKNRKQCVQGMELATWRIDSKLPGFLALNTKYLLNG